jgi:hypothetical protein
MPKSIEDRVLDLEASLSWYKGAFWTAAFVSGTLIGLATFIGGRMWTDITNAAGLVEKQKSAALQEIDSRKVAVECDMRATYWAYSFHFSSRQTDLLGKADPNPQVRNVPIGYVATTSDAGSGGFYSFKQTEYYHENERFWKFTPEGEGTDEFIETMSLDGKVKRTFQKVALPGFVFQTEVLNPNAQRGDRYRLRMRLIAPYGCTKLVMGA